MGPLAGRLLDVGSGVGAWAQSLRKAGAAEIVALDPSEASIAIARERYDMALVGTIESVTLEQLGGRPFDVIVVADVLEHLVDPWQTLMQLRQLAGPDAMLAISVPNLRFYRLVGNLVFRGEFEYEPWGVRDWTHLRWFTKRSLTHTLIRSGWQPHDWARTRTLKGRLLAMLSDQLANDFLWQQLMVVAFASAAPPSRLDL